MIIGSSSARVTVLILHDLPEGTEKSEGCIHPLTLEWRELINKIGGNNWRKIFNTYAKLCHLLGLDHKSLETWQDYRDNYLLGSEGAFQLLCFGNKDELRKQADLLSEEMLVLITGKKCAEAIGVSERLYWLDQSFAQVIGRNWLVCPYFDYRQLSNIKIEQLVELIHERISPD